jgi:Ohr subfamily peroxiredoxin
MKTLYTAHVTSISGRDGKADSDDKNLSVKLVRPGSKNAGTNPEQLFAAGYSACFGSAVEAIAKKQNVVVKEIKIEATVALNQDDNGFFLSAELNVLLADLEQSTAENLVKEAHQMCPYSKATRNNIKVTLKANNRQIN